MPNSFDLPINPLNGSTLEVKSDDASALTGTGKVLIVQNGIKETTTQEIADLGGGGSSYLVYTANLTQASTNPPTAVESETPTITGVVYSAPGVGQYSVTFDNPDNGRVWCIIGSANNAFTLAMITSSTTITIRTLEYPAFTGADEYLDNTSFEIRIYPV